MPLPYSPSGASPKEEQESSLPVPCHHAFNHRAKGSPCFRERDPDVVAQSVGMSIADKLGVGIVINLREAVAPGQNHWVLRGKQGPYGRSQALRPGGNWPERCPAPIQFAAQGSDLTRAGKELSGGKLARRIVFRQR